MKNKILKTATSGEDHEAMAKDFHLLDTAIRTDRIVVSLDNTVLRLFVAATSTVGEIREVIWINPVETPDVVIKWLENDTPPEESRKLRFRSLPRP